MKPRPFVPIVAAVVGFALTCAGPLARAAAKHAQAHQGAGLSASQISNGRALYKLLRRLQSSEENGGPGTTFAVQIEYLQDVAPGLLAALPSGPLKLHLSFATNAYVDAQQIQLECDRYVYLDLLRKTKTAKIVAKYQLPVNLNNSNPNTRVSPVQIGTMVGDLLYVARGATDEAAPYLK